jgi:signal transduction histidine kinase
MNDTQTTISDICSDIWNEGKNADVSVAPLAASRVLDQPPADIIALLAHDVRNPLSAVLGYLDLLDDIAAERRTEEEEQFVQRIKENALTIHCLISNYLDLARFESGTLVLHKTPHAVAEILQRVVAQYEAAALRRHLLLSLSITEGLAPIVGDMLALERVFANLVQHAVHGTPEQGQVAISAWQLTGRGGVIVEVRDTGPGMTQEELACLFEESLLPATLQHSGGAGVELFVVKALVEAHGGRVEVESHPGQGACFRVFLPSLAEEHLAFASIAA